MFDHVAIAGATGAVGQELLKVLEKRSFPFKKLTLLASARSIGKKMNFKGESLEVQELKEDSFKGVDLALFSAGGGRSKQFGPIAVESGAIVVDNSSAFRMDPNTPLVVPEVNPEDVKWHKGLIANPNCSTIIMLMAAFPIHKINPVQKMVVSTYQAASGAGAAAMEELRVQARDYLDGKEIKPDVLPHPIAFNAFSHNSKIDPQNGFNEEEIKMVKETHKMLHDDSISISPTCVRIGTFRAHAESIHMELKKEANLDEIRRAFKSFQGVRVVDDIEKNYFPMPLETSGLDEVLVGRIRKDIGKGSERRMSLFCCGDQLLKGAALNAVQIAELLI